MGDFREPRTLRLACRQGVFTGPTSTCAPGYVQANLVLVPAELAESFALFCQRNPKPCPLLERSVAGSYSLRDLASDVDLRTDLPAYRIYEQGRLSDESTDILQYWRDDLVTFLLGCSFSFDAAMDAAGYAIRHWQQGCNVPMYKTTRPCRSAGPFRGHLVVSMRPVKAEAVQDVIDLSASYGFAHGAPVHVGDGRTLGIAELDRPDYGDAVEILADEIPVFWACGVTPQLVIEESRIPFAITHAPGCMFVSDRKSADFQWQLPDAR